MIPQGSIQSGGLSVAILGQHPIWWPVRGVLRAVGKGGALLAHHLLEQRSDVCELLLGLLLLLMQLRQHLLLQDLLLLQLLEFLLQRLLLLLLLI